jgi:hypothetical protein
VGFGSTERERERERVTLRENNTFIITAHCGVWFHRERERVTLRENNTFIITAHCGVWFHREREREGFFEREHHLQPLWPFCGAIVSSE